MSLQSVRLAPGESFIAACAAAIRGFIAPDSADLAQARIILPNLMLAPTLTAELLALAGQTLLLPQIDTLPGTVEAWVADIACMSDARRLLILHSQLRQRGWFDDAALWDVAAELITLFDELSAHAIGLPASEEAFVAQLAQAFELQDTELLAFEARVVYTLWCAEAAGLPSRSLARQQAVARWAQHQRDPLVFIAEEAVSADTLALLEAMAERLPVLLIEPDRALAQGALAQCAGAAWPLGEARGLPLRTRALALSRNDAEAAAARMRCVACDGLEALALEATRQVLSWLASGRKQIALIAADRLAARRTRALLERHGVMVCDESGWKLSTTRVAASVDALFETLSSDGWHRALVDLLDAPFLFADLDAGSRSRAVEQILRAQQQSHVTKGLANLLAALRDAGDCQDGADLIARVLTVRQSLSPSREASVVQWLQLLDKALQTLGAKEALAKDPAGEVWLEWLAARTAELAEEPGRLSFVLWRGWFNREMDISLFRDRSIESPVVMTYLAATRLRRFDAAIIIGADVEHLAPVQVPGWLAHAGVRRELGLPGLEVGVERLREDLAGLALSAGELVCAWQRLRRDEIMLPAADIERWLQTMQVVLERSLVAEAQAVVSIQLPARRQQMPVVLLAAGQVPDRVSASALKNLIECPYRYFASRVLRLQESDELLDALEKSDYGDRMHSALQHFHEEFPVLTGLPRDAVLAGLQRHCEAVFEHDVARNFLDHAWRIAAHSQLASYIDWQLKREAAGWYWQASEVERRQNVRLSDGHSLSLVGRIDRVDRAASGEGVALLDYKTRTLKRLTEQTKDSDDIQLAFYTLLQGDDVAQACYVALADKSGVADAALAEAGEAAGLLGERIDSLFSAMHDGAGLPAHGASSACAWCEMRGLCRKDWHEGVEDLT